MKWKTEKQHVAVHTFVFLSTLCVSFRLVLLFLSLKFSVFFLFELFFFVFKDYYIIISLFSFLLPNLPVYPYLLSFKCLPLSPLVADTYMYAWFYKQQCRLLSLYNATHAPSPEMFPDPQV